MSGAGFILAINLFAAGMLSACFLSLAIYDPRQVAARWMAAAYGLGVPYALSEFAVATFGPDRLLVVGAFAVILAAMALFNVGLARHCSVRVPWRAMAGLFVASTAGCYLIQDMPRDSLLRMFLYQAPYFLFQVMGVWILVRSAQRSTLERLLVVLLSLSALQFLSKPFLSQALGGTGVDPQAYLATRYALVSQSLGAVFAMAIALLVLVIIIRTVLADAAEESATDRLSGVLNRRGFERQAYAALRTAVRSGAPLSLIIADLDHFKAINDRFGHAAGDRTIQGFASFLQKSSGDRHIVGRLGGEEFAVLLPHTGIAAARLFAEAIRTAYPTITVDGIPEDWPLSASFGVAERQPGEDVSGMLERADGALYEAKESGRNCVRLAPQHGPKTVASVA